MLFGFAILQKSRYNIFTVHCTVLLFKKRLKKKNWQVFTNQLIFCQQFLMYKNIITTPSLSYAHEQCRKP